MKDHKYAVGQMVYFSAGAGRQVKSGSAGYKIVKLLPAAYNDQQYRVKSALDGHERVVKESELR